MRIGILLAMAAGLLASAASAENRQLDRLLAMTPESVADGISIKDDSLEVNATLSTEPAFAEKHGLLGIVWDDSFVRAFVGKTSGKATYQVYQRLTYVASTYREFTRVNYETPDSTLPASVDVIPLERNADCRNRQVMVGCIHHEDVAFDVDETLLRKIAATYRPGDGKAEPRAWKFRFKSQAGADADEYLMPAEVAGVLLAVDRYRKDHGLPR